MGRISLCMQILTVSQYFLSSSFSKRYMPLKSPTVFAKVLPPFSLTSNQTNPPIPTPKPLTKQATASLDPHTRTLSPSDYNPQHPLCPQRHPSPNRRHPHLPQAILHHPIRSQQLRIDLRQRQHVLALLTNHVHIYSAASTHLLKRQLHVFDAWGASAEGARLQERLPAHPAVEGGFAVCFVGWGEGGDLGGVEAADSGGEGGVGGGR